MVTITYSTAVVHLIFVNVAFIYPSIQIINLNAVQDTLKGAVPYFGVIMQQWGHKCSFQGGGFNIQYTVMQYSIVNTSIQ